MSRGILHVGPMVTANDVYVAIMTRRPADSVYVKAVFKSYIDVKFARGKTKYEVSLKLETLEIQFPQYVREFHAVRAEYNLPKSRIFPPLRDSTTRRNTTAHPSPSSLGTNPLGRVQTSTGVMTTTTSTRAPVSRPVPVDEDEPPPPPYTSQDPEPDSTRLLQERLAAEAEAAAISPMGLGGPSSSTPTSASNIRPTSSAPSPRPSPRTSNSGGPRPGIFSTSSASMTTNPPTSHSRTPSFLDRPATPPIDAEDAEVREQSLLEEAKRASIAEERDRLELEQAMQLSLADAEAHQVRQTQIQGQGQDGEAGSSSSNQRQYMPVVAEDEDEVVNSRRASSYHALGYGGTGADHRRATSDAQGGGSGGGGSAGERPLDVVDGMSTLMIPGSWHNGSTSASGSGSGAISRTSSIHAHSDIHEDLMDIPDYSALTQEPLTPLKTGVTIKSNNPFLSPQEREQLDTALPSIPGSSSSTSTSIRNTVNDDRIPNPPRHPSLASNAAATTTPPRDAPGSAYTLSSYSPPPPNGSLSTRTNKKLPRPPSLGLPSSPPSGTTGTFPWDEEPVYAPPPGPPPSHLIVGDRSMPPPRIPDRPDTSAAVNMSISEQGVMKSPLTSSRSMISQSGEDPLDMLRDYDTVFLVDDSTSMQGDRWTQARAALKEVAEIAARYDDTGVDIYFLNNKRVGRELRTAEEVEDLFRGLEPKGATPTGQKMESILREYMSKLERSVSASATPGTEPVKAMNLIVVTDGVFARSVTSRLRQLASDPTMNRHDLLLAAPTDDPESVLVSIAKRLDRGEFPLSQIGIQLVQIGDDPEAREALQELDDGLASNHGIRDIVDTVLYDGEAMSAGLIVKVLLGGINRRLDRRLTG